jgi:hypothetical protein
MATYREIQNRVRAHNGFVPKTCWIAHVMSDLGLTKNIAPNRISASSREHPCPPEKRPAILSALEHFGMVKSETRKSN